jgi:hypothetical protein
VRCYYRRLEQELAAPQPLDCEGVSQPLVVIPIDSWNQVAQKALRFALTLSREIVALHVKYAGDTSALEREWEAHVAAPARLANQPVPSLAVLHSPIGLSYSRSSIMCSSSRGGIRIAPSPSCCRNWFNGIGTSTSSTTGGPS